MDSGFGDFDAYLVDCDGTLADSMPLHYKAWCAALADWGAHFEEALFYEWAGRPTERIVKMLNERQALSMPPVDVAHTREEYYLELLPQIQPIASVLAHVRAAQGLIPLAVVSGSSRTAVQKTLDYLQLGDCFQIIVGAEDYKRGKPDPQPFLVAAERLGVAPERCLAFEDAELGFQSANAAGMPWVSVPAMTLHHPALK